ncbi:MAG: GntR family transcriptional regulator [Spirochaetales bacterium]|nr:GntR family transcriptional regulator [Spirochaetales bacterium]
MAYIIDKESNMPVYRQIAQHITSLIQEGALKAGDRLFPERELAERLGLARGTVKKAYAELEKDGIIQVIRGSGSFIALDEDSAPQGRKEQASGIINKALIELGGLDFKLDEIRTMFQVILMERENNLNTFHIAAIDCNPEALAIFEKQLLYVSHLKLHKFLMEDVMAEPDPEKIFNEFDIILTTSTHYEELIHKMESLKERFIKAAVSPSQQTIIDIASIPAGESIGIISRSFRFYEIIKDRLKTFQIDENHIDNLYEKDGTALPDFLEKRKYIIVPPDCNFEYSSEHRTYLQKFRESGGKVIVFEYRIQRGSMIYIEERIADLLN